MRLGQFTMAMCQYSKKLLEKDNSVTIHERKLRILATELNKTKENLAALIMHEFFEESNIQHNLRSQTDF